MENNECNIMATAPLKGLFWKMGLPMIVSMVLQALYNVVDSVFVANIQGVGAIANEALTLAFPVQILMIALGVGTGVGINACLSRSLGENAKEKASQIVGNGIFLAAVIYIFFLIFGLFLAEPFIGAFSTSEEVVSMGGAYLKICCTLSLGSIGFTVYERFLQATGKTSLSTIAQITGAVANVVLDYVFIFPLDMGVEGAAWATVIGQWASLIMAMIFHYAVNKDIGNGIKFLRPSLKIIKEIYNIGISAAIMQALLSVMMAGMNLILGTAEVDSTIIVGAFGIYYKIQQIALFSCFGLSNTIITILSFNYGKRDKQRAVDCVKYGIVDALIVTAVITVIFEALADQIAALFALSGGESEMLVPVCSVAVRIGAAGFLLMGLNVAVQGVLQALGYALRPLILALLRLVVFVFPTAYLLTLSRDAVSVVWWCFPIAELLTAIVTIIFLIGAKKRKIDTIETPLA